MKPSYLYREDKPRLAFFYTAPDRGKTGGNLPMVMFLGGFKSDMGGSKATYLEESCKKRGQAYLRFDYSGHGLSGGDFTDGSIGQWKEDALDVLDHVVKQESPDKGVILIGSSMGGWIAMHLLLERDKLIKAMIGIAAAPDFTKWIEEKLSDAQKEIIDEQGFVNIPNDYSDQPYVITKKLLKDGREQFLLNKKHSINAPITLIQGKKDKDVPWQTAIEIKNHFQGSPINIIFVDDGDHRLSRIQDLKLIDKELEKMSRSALA